MEADNESSDFTLLSAPVGLEVHGWALISGDQILAVEFRPNTLVDGKCEYRCDIPSGGSLCR